MADIIRGKRYPRGRPSRAAQELAALVARWPTSPKRGGRPRLWDDEALERIDRRIADLIAARAVRSRREAVLRLPDLLWPEKATAKHKRGWRRLVPGLQRALGRYRHRVTGE
jgi:hypothetical protein